MYYYSLEELKGRVLKHDDWITFVINDQSFLFKVSGYDEPSYLDVGPQRSGCGFHEDCTSDFRKAVEPILGNDLYTFLKNTPGYGNGTGTWPVAESYINLQLGVEALYRKIEEYTKTSVQEPAKYPFTEAEAFNNCLIVNPSKNGTRTIEVRGSDCEIKGSTRKRRAAIYR